MKKVNFKKLFTLIALGLGIYIANFILSLFLLKWLWPKIADILFSPELLSSGQVIVNLTLGDVFWVAIYLGVILTALFGRLITVTKSTKKELKKDLVSQDNPETLVNVEDN